jgi:hypothetical protein
MTKAGTEPQPSPERGPWPEIDAAEWDYAGRYLRWIATTHLKLADWRVWLMTDPAPDDGCIATILPTEGRKRAQVWLERDWQPRGAEDKRHSLVHELLHLHHRDQTDLIRKGLHESGYLPQSAYDLLWEGFRLATEVMVDEMADVIAPSLPLYGVDLPSHVAVRDPLDT